MIRTIIASVFLAATLTASTASAAETKTAMETFKESHANVMTLVKKKAGDDALQKEVDAFLDYEWIAKSALGGPLRYEKKCAPRCAEFEELLAKLIRKNYLKRITQADTGSIEYLGEEVRKNGTRAKVDTRITFTKDGKEQTLDISYVMHLVDNVWVCRNIYTDKVSMARTYKYDFAGILRDEGIDGLILRLQNKLAEIAKG